MALKHGIIAAGSTATAKAGLQILRAGGNAFDAALAALMTAFVSEGASISAAGGGFLLAHTADQKQVLYDFFTQTPLQKRPEKDLDFRKITIDFGDSTQDFHIGLASMAVPGNIAGVFHIHKQLGRMPFEEVAHPAIEVAKNGLPLDQFQYRLIDLLEPIVKASPEGRTAYTNEDGTLKKVGDPIHFPYLEDVLYTLAKEGAREFYEGEIAQRLVNDCRDNGGYLTLQDLSSYQVVERKPLEIQYRKHTLFTNPPPSSGGGLIAFGLRLLEEQNMTTSRFASAERVRLLGEVMEQTNHARRQYFDAHLYHPGLSEFFLSDGHVQQYSNKIGSTTHISVMDTQGNTASVTTSSGEGAGYFIPGTGIMMNNMLGEEDLNPQGFHQWPNNQRISSMMAPTIVVAPDGGLITLGSSGSNRIRTAILQVLSNCIDHGMSIEEAVAADRIHLEGNLLNLEPLFNEEVCQQLREMTSWDLLPWKAQSMFYGGVNAVKSDQSGRLTGAGDARRFGVVLGD